MISKPSLSKMYSECYPIAISEYKNDIMEEPGELDDCSLENAFLHLEKEKLAALMEILTRTLNQVLLRCSKVLELQNTTCLDLPKKTLDEILTKIILLAEREPYGVRGGTLVVLFSFSPGQPSVKIGRFQLDPSKVSTYELHLTLHCLDHMKLKFKNLLRKLQGKPQKLVVDDDFSLVKKKLYRSSTFPYQH